MIQVHSLHHNSPNSSRTTRSHVLTPHDTVTLLCIIDGGNESTLSIVEDHILESISSTEWRERQVQDDFAYVTESYNAFLANMSQSDISDIRVVLGVLIGDTVTLTTVGGAGAILTERNGTITDISVHENKAHYFQAVSGGKIPDGGTVYLANDDILSILGGDVLSELARLTPELWHETGKRIIEREVTSSLHIIRISNKSYTENIDNTRTGRGGRQSSLMREQGAVFLEYIRSKKMWERTKGLIQKIPILKKGKYQYAFLAVGISILFLLIYLLVSSMISVFNTSGPDTKNLLIQAKVLVDEGQKLMANPQAFNTKITEAEKILFELRKNQVHLPDTQDLLGRIASMKKEAYGIQTVDMTHLPSIIPFNSAEISPVGIFQKNNKFNLIGEQGSILDYAPGDASTKIIKYPGNEILKNFDVSEDGSTLYILTNEKRILTARRDAFAYVNVTGQPTWEDAVGIRTFNGNLYLLEPSRSQIQRHKPGVNGFSQKSSVLTKEQPGIFGYSIDGGVYLYMDDGKIYHTLGGVVDKPITLNKIPGEWGLNTTLTTKFITKTNLSYTYILNGNKVWIFQPNSRRFQDINAWTYVNQLELKTDDTIKSIDVPRDGMLYVVTDKGVYEIKFEIIDGKVIFK